MERAFLTVMATLFAFALVAGAEIAHYRQTHCLHLFDSWVFYQPGYLNGIACQ